MNLPKDWSDVTIAQYYKLSAIINVFHDPIDRDIQVLALFSGKPVKEIEDINGGDFLKLVKGLKFMDELPSEKITPYFEMGKNKYKACLLTTDMKAGQFIDFNSCGKGCDADELPYHMHELIGAMCLTRKHWNDKWEYVGYSSTEEDFLKLPISIAYPLYVFFCKVLINLQKPIQDYSLKKAKTEMKKVEKMLQLI